MMIWEKFSGLHFAYEEHAPTKRRYSVTSDILSYQLCPQQYALYKVRKYEPSMTNQIFFGTVIHQVLDKIHMHYKGILNPEYAGLIPTDEDINRYFDEVDCALRARRITAGKVVKAQALDIIKRFNHLEGPTLYPRVVNTECRLQTDKTNYILIGNVDVLATSPENPDLIEIWDYKGTNQPSWEDQRYMQYIYQMQVYAELYRKQTGVMPQKAILYFLNALSGPITPTSRPRNALLEVPLTQKTIDIALEDFTQTVSSIEQSRNSGIWAPPQSYPPKATCDICDKRWSCPYCEQKYTMRYP